MNCQCCHIYYLKVGTVIVWGNICAPLQTKLILVQLPGLSSFHWKRFSLSTVEAVIESPWPSLQKLPRFWIWASSCLKLLPRLFDPNKTHQMGTLFSNLVCIWNWNLGVKGLSQQHPVLHCCSHSHQGWFIHLRNKHCASLHSSQFPPSLFS